MQELHGWHDHVNLSLHCILFYICSEIFFSYFLGSPRGLLLIWSSGLWLFLCFSLWYSLYSFAFLQVHYPAMITCGTSDMHRGSNVCAFPRAHWNGKTCHSALIIICTIKTCTYCIGSKSEDIKNTKHNQKIIHNNSFTLHGLLLLVCHTEICMFHC